MINVAAQTTIACPPARVFAILDDFTRASEWNERCVAIEQVNPGERAPGTKLVYRYRFREHGREGAISGEISDYRRDAALAMHYADHAFDIRVRFELVAHDGGTKLVHEANIELKTFVVKLMAPLLRGAARRQTEAIVERLRAIAERG
jgi:uncharacterized protein YndB with AHSA1/START domain